MDNDILYDMTSYEGVNKFEKDLLDNIRNTPWDKVLVIALCYINRQSFLCGEINKSIKIFSDGFIEDYLNKGWAVIDNKIEPYNIVNELDKIIPDGDESTGWEFDFVQNALISFLMFFDLAKKEKIELFVDVVSKVIDNLDVLWYEYGKPLGVDENRVFNKEIAIIINAIKDIKNKKHYSVSVSSLGSMNINDVMNS